MAYGEDGSAASVTIAMETLLIPASIADVPDAVLDRKASNYV